VWMEEQKSLFKVCTSAVMHVTTDQNLSLFLLYLKEGNTNTHPATTMAK
jgi:hypothetical protein